MSKKIKNKGNCHSRGKIENLDFSFNPLMISYSVEKDEMKIIITLFILKIIYKLALQHKKLVFVSINLFIFAYYSK